MGADYGYYKIFVIYGFHLQKNGWPLTLGREDWGEDAEYSFSEEEESNFIIEKGKVTEFEEDIWILLFKRDNHLYNCYELSNYEESPIKLKDKYIDKIKEVVGSIFDEKYLFIREEWGVQ